MHCNEGEGKATLLGFIGSPFTLAAYAVEGRALKNCFHTKRMMHDEPAILHAILDHIAQNIAAYASHQIDCGAQVIQVFESWAHHPGPDDFDIFAKPYADNAVALIKEKHLDTPLIYFANGGSSFLERQADMKCDMLCGLEGRHGQGAADCPPRQGYFGQRGPPRVAVS